MSTIVPDCSPICDLCSDGDAAAPPPAAAFERGVHVSLEVLCCNQSGRDGIKRVYVTLRPGKCFFFLLVTDVSQMFVQQDRYRNVAETKVEYQAHGVKSRSATSFPCLFTFTPVCLCLLGHPMTGRLHLRDKQTNKQSQ